MTSWLLEIVPFVEACNCSAWFTDLRTALPSVGTFPAGNPISRQAYDVFLCCRSALRATPIGLLELSGCVWHTWKLLSLQKKMQQAGRQAAPPPSRPSCPPPPRSPHPLPHHFPFHTPESPF